jgi:4-amino-4-deoxy-L-arabinose transferase-like glycosyltransferase
MWNLFDVSLPLIGFCAIVRVIRQQGCEWRRAVLGAATIWGVFVTLEVEALSIPHALTGDNLAICWVFALLVCGVYLLKTRPGSLGERIRSSATKPRTLDRWSIGLLFGVGLLAGLIGVTAILSPPNTGDVLFYHMPRVVMWMSHRSVQFYPTLNYAQLIYGSWAEYVMLQLDLLFGGDRLVNLVQWFTYLGSALAVSLIVRSLGARLPGQVLAAVICSTLPVAVLEASGAKNNCVVAFWLATAVYFLLDFSMYPTWANTLGFGAAAALAVFTKGTAYLFLPAMAAAGWWIATAHAKRVFLYRLPMLAIILLVINGPLYARNYMLTGSPTGVGFKDLDEDLDFANQNHSITGIAANIVRNVAINLSGTAKTNTIIEQGASGLIRLVGESPDDPRALKLPHVLRLRFQTNPPTAREDMVGAPVQFLLMIVAVVVAFIYWRENPATAWYALGVLGSFVTFCALLRWERWGVRYQIPVLVLASALIGVIVDRYYSHAAPLLGMVLIVAALPFALRNELRPLLPLRFSAHRPVVQWNDNSILTRDRTAYYFSDLREDMQQSYVGAAEAVRKGRCRNIALDISIEDDDYPFLALLNVNENEPALSYSGVYNLSRSIADTDQPQPCAVVCFACSKVKRKWVQYRAVGGRVSTFGDVAVFSADGHSPNIESAPSTDKETAMPQLASTIQRDFEDIKEKNTSPDFTAVMSRAESLARSDRDRAREMRIGMESVNRTIIDASVIMLYTTRLRREATEGQTLTVDERGALLAADESLRSLNAGKMARLSELRSAEEAAMQSIVGANPDQSRGVVRSVSTSP